MRYTSTTYEEDCGSYTRRSWFNVNLENETEVCDFASALIDVLSRVCDKDEGDLEEEWMTMSFDTNTMKPNREGIEEFFNTYAGEVLEELWGLDESAYDIFNFVETEMEDKPNYGSGDDGFAAAMFPVKESVLRESSETYLVVVSPVKGNRAKLSEAIDMWNEENPSVEFRYNDYHNQYFNFNMTMANAQDVLEFFLPYGRSIVDKIDVIPN